MSAIPACMVPSFYETWTLARWLEHIEHRDTVPMRLGVQRVQQVARYLHIDTQTAGIITVAGTNGKGTTVTALASMYRAAGYRAGAYTSPHLLCVRERIQINGIMIPEDLLCQAFCVIESARQTLSLVLTYFEVCTLAAFWYFKQQHVDLMIIEVGLGGRFDATNAWDPDLAIITTIDFDHQAQLGNTLEHIGFEKAGIMRPHRPVIYADTIQHMPQTIRICAALLHAPLYVCGQAYDVQQPGIPMGHPWHPHAIAAACFASICLQSRYPLSDHHRRQGIETMVLWGRLQLQRIAGHVVLLDVSHNAQSVEYLADYLQRLHPERRVHAVFAALRDKNIETMIVPMLLRVTYWYGAQLPGPRATDRAWMDGLFRKYGIIVQSWYADPWMAFQAAQACAHPDDVIVVFGSFLTVAGVLQYCTQEIAID